MSQQDLYTGSAGQAAVMSEFLIRGYNVAVPEVDRGDDLFVVHDLEGSLRRIQVKTATAHPRRAGYSAQFRIPLAQLMEPDGAAVLYYVLVVRHASRWSDFMVVSRAALYEEHRVHGIGNRLMSRKPSLQLYLSFREAAVMCSRRDIRKYRNNFGDWPPIAH